MRLRKLKPEVSWSFTEFNDLHPVDNPHRMFLYGNSASPGFVDMVSLAKLR